MSFEIGFAIDVSYVDFDSNDFVIYGEGSTVAVNGFSLQGAYYYRITEKLELYARAGVFMWDSKVKSLVIDANFLLGTDAVKNDGSDLTYGVGVDYHLTKHISMGGIIQNYDVGSNNMFDYGVTAAFHF